MRPSCSSFRRKPESTRPEVWTPAFAGVTAKADEPLPRRRQLCSKLARPYAVLLLAMLLVGLAAAPSYAREVYGRSEKELNLYAGNQLLAGWRVREARELVDRLLARAPKDPDAQALDAHVLFFEGRYGESLQVLERLRLRGPFRDLVAATVEATRGFSSRSSEHFELFWANPKDEVLVAPALEALELAHAALEKTLGFVPEAKVRVEIYPSVSAFTAVSTLTRSEVATSGTIGLCKFNRLMITSPRATLWGYRWRDTLCHEYVHLAVYRLSRGTAPIWIHEGIAKYLEATWRGAEGKLDPASQALLARRLEKGTLIPLEAMSPSVAKLPSAEETALAFAEVGTMMTFLVEREGPEVLKKLLSNVAAGRTDREALESVWPGSFASFEEAWKAWVRKLPLRREALQILGVPLAESRKDEGEEPGAIPDPEARDYARLGDLLRARGRFQAAAVEYAKAYARGPAAPGVASRHALGRLLLGEYEEALSAAEAALEFYPDLGVLWARKGQALLALKRPQEALSAFRELLEINPFDTPGRRGLGAAAEALGDEKELALQRWALALLERSDDAPHRTIERRPNKN
jgi:tetratricopeptide (TPR) repeat protein